MAVLVKAGGGGKKLQAKTVTAGTSAKTVNADEGFAMESVTVNPTPTEEKSVTAGTSATSVTPSSGKHLSKVTVNPTPSQSKTVTPKASNQTVTPDSGKLLSSVVVNGDADLIASNIREGVDIFGVLGTMAEGASGVVVGEITVPANTTNLTIAHNLGVTPSAFAIVRTTYSGSACNAAVYPINGNALSMRGDSGRNAVALKGLDATTMTVEYADYSGKWNGTYHWVVWA